MGVKDMTNKRFAQFEVIERTENDKYGNARWRCICDCGKEFVAVGSSIRNGHTKSCGCLQRKTASEMSGTHRKSKTPLYKAWAGMKQRCENPNSTAYADYGAKGVTVCEEWHDFEVFYQWATTNGYKPGLTIERKDCSKGYCPENCTFATRAEQNRNTTRTHRVLCEGGAITAAEAARVAGLSRSTVAKWIRNGEVSTMTDILEKTKTIKKEK